MHLRAYGTASLLHIDDVTKRKFAGMKGVGRLQYAHRDLKLPRLQSEDRYSLVRLETNLIIFTCNRESQMTLKLVSSIHYLACMTEG